MQLTSTTQQVTEHTLVLSDADLQRYLDDPAAFRADVLAQRKNGGGKNGKVIEVLHKQRAERAVASPKAKASKARKTIDREPCQNCGVLIAVYRQGRHKCASAVGAKSSATD